MSQFLTVNKIVGHMIVKQGVFVLKVTIPEDCSELGGLSGLQIQSRNYAVMGSILESDNSNVCTFGRKLMVEGFGLKKNVNLVTLLTRLITLHGTEQEGQRVGYFRARIRKDNYKLEVDVERMVEQNW